MIILAPTENSESYFLGLAKDAWTNYTYRDPDAEDGLIKDRKTLVISCEIDEGSEKIPVKLHYRYLRGEIYCFVEECE
jgi:hypothetical protein